MLLPLNRFLSSITSRWRLPLTIKKVHTRHQQWHNGEGKIYNVINAVIIPNIYWSTPKEGSDFWSPGGSVSLVAVVGERVASAIDLKISQNSVPMSSKKQQLEREVKHTTPRPPVSPLTRDRPHLWLKTAVPLSTYPAINTFSVGYIHRYLCLQTHNRPHLRSCTTVPLSQYLSAPSPLIMHSAASVPYCPTIDFTLLVYSCTFSLSCTHQLPHLPSSTAAPIVYITITVLTFSHLQWCFCLYTHHKDKEGYSNLRWHLFLRIHHHPHFWLYLKQSFCLYTHHCPHLWPSKAVLLSLYPSTPTVMNIISLSTWI